MSLGCRFCSLILGLLSGASLLAPLAAAQVNVPPRPNVVLIIVDDVGYGDLGVHGNPIAETPHLDALHAESVRFTDFHVSPTCSPTRASLMTGRHNNRTGVWHTVGGWSLLRADEATMADVFRAGGYRTGIFGKWHLGDAPPFHAHERGFDVAFTHGGGGVGQTPDYWGNDYFDDTFFRNGTPEATSGYVTDVFFREALRFIEAEAAADRPFFAYLALNAAHGPFNVPEADYARYADADLPEVMKRFYGMVSNIDANMGRLVERLDALGVAENTVLVFMSDNGTARGFREEDGRVYGFNAGMRGIKGSPYDGGHRVPFFVRWPAGAWGGTAADARDVEALAAHVDVLPTFIDAFGLERPDSLAEHRLDGRSLVPLLGGGGDWPARILVIDSQRVQEPSPSRPTAVLMDQWRLVNGSELYHVRRDPGQADDVSAEHPALVQALRAYYHDWWRDVAPEEAPYTRFVLGSEPDRLTAHDAHAETGDVAWNQTHVRQGYEAAGFWTVEVAEPGPYRIALRRWPREADRPIRAAGPAGAAATRTREAVPEGVALDLVEAGVEVGGTRQTAAVADGDREVAFEVELPAGPAELRAWFTDGGGTTRTAYYVYVEPAEGEEEEPKE